MREDGLKITLLLCMLLFLVGSGCCDLISARSQDPHGWQRGERANPDQVIKFTIFLKEKGVDVLQRRLDDVSNPNSLQFGKFLTRDQILGVTSSSSDDISQITQWIKLIAPQTQIINRGSSLQIITTVRDVERLLHLKIYEWIRLDDGKIFYLQHGTSFIPRFVLNKIDFIFGINDFPPYRPPRTHPHDTQHDLRPKKHQQPTPKKPQASRNHLGKRTSSMLDLFESNCEPNATVSGSRPKTLIVPSTIKQLYNFPNISSDSLSPISIGIVQFGPAAYSLTDFGLFTNFSTTPEDLLTVPKIQTVYGPGINGSLTPDAESNLDMQQILSIASDIPNITLYYYDFSAWMLEFTEYFLNHPTDPIVSVLSISWATDELETSCTAYANTCNDFAIAAGPKAYNDRVEVNLLKMSLLGVSIFVSSGDQGAPGWLNHFCTSSNIFSGFPASSAYVTAVGGTTFDPTAVDTPLTVSGPTICNISACDYYSLPVSSACNHSVCYTPTRSEVPATWPQVPFTTGGGFSVFNSVPSYQAKHVAKYIDIIGRDLLPFQTLPFIKNRAYPDISSLSTDIFLVHRGSGVSSFGTSASAPHVAGMAAIINSARVQLGKSVVGLFNGLLYDLYEKNEAAFNDQEKGHNWCTTRCCVEGMGYVAAKGWDPVVGLGSVDFGILFNHAVYTLP